MKLRAFSQNLSSEIENLFATLGNNSMPDDLERLDQSVNFDDIMTRIKNLDSDSEAARKKDENV